MPNVFIHATADSSVNSRIFKNFREALQSGYQAKDSWILADRKVVGKATAFVLLGDGKCPVWHLNQTRDCEYRPRSKAYVHFRRLLGLESRKFISAFGDKWTHHHDWLSSGRIAQHLNSSKILGGFAGDEQKLVILDVDFHEPVLDMIPCLNALQAVLDEVPVLMETLGAYGLHFQVKEKDVDGLHILFFMRKPLPSQEVEHICRNWISEIEVKHADVLDARRNVALVSDKQRIHLVDKFLSQSTGIRLPLCNGRMMLLDKALLPLPNGKADVEHYLEWATTKNPVSMPTPEVMSFVAGRFKKESTSESVFKSKTKKQPVARKKSNGIEEVDQQEPLVWKGNARRIFSNFFLGKGKLPEGCLPEISGVLARFAPEFCAAEEDAVDAYGILLRNIPESGWYVSSRLENQKLDRLIADFRRQVRDSFKGRLRQNDQELSDKKVKEIATRWKAVGYNPFDSSTWSNSWTKLKVDITWDADEVLEFEQQLRPLMGRAGRDLSMVDFINDVLALVSEKEKQENGISLSYWQMYFVDRWGLDCGKTSAGDIRHQNIVECLVDLGVLMIIQQAMFKTGGAKGLARRFAAGKRVKEKQGWVFSEKTVEERIEEVIGEL